jgi:hypothetical protein
VQAGSSAVVALPVGGGLRRLGWLGTAGSAALVAWLAFGRMTVGRTSPAAPPMLVGWELLSATVELGGHAEEAFRFGLAVLWLALPLAVTTGGFRYASRPGQAAVLLVGLAGLVAAVPMLAVAAVLAANAILWAMAVVLGALLVLVVLLRLLTWPFRR